jgi:hypothetical protein
MNKNTCLHYRYDMQTMYGQERKSAVWRRIKESNCHPDTLPSSPAKAGYTGQVAIGTGAG